MKKAMWRHHVKTTILLDLPTEVLEGEINADGAFFTIEVGKVTVEIAYHAQDGGYFRAGTVVVDLDDKLPYIAAMGWYQMLAMLQAESMEARVAVTYAMLLTERTNLN